MLYLEILKAKSELEGYIVNYFSKYFSSVVINGKKLQPNNNKNPLIKDLEEKSKKYIAERRGTLPWVVLQSIERDLAKLDRQGDLWKTTPQNNHCMILYVGTSRSYF